MALSVRESQGSVHTLDNFSIIRYLVIGKPFGRVIIKRKYFDLDTFYSRLFL